jgi:hypothetical protein
MIDFNDLLVWRDFVLEYLYFERKNMKSVKGHCGMHMKKHGNAFLT